MTCYQLGSGSLNPLAYVQEACWERISRTENAAAAGAAADGVTNQSIFCSGSRSVTWRRTVHSWRRQWSCVCGYIAHAVVRRAWCSQSPS